MPRSMLLASFVFLAACSSESSIDTTALHGKWNYDMSMTMRSFVRTVNSDSAMLPPGWENSVVNNLEATSLKMGPRPTVTIDARRLQSNSLTGRKDYTYRVIGVDENVYTIELTNDSGNIEVIRIKALRNSVAIESRPCETKRDSCNAMRRRLADVTQIEIPDLPEESIENSPGACATLDNPKCGLSVERSQIVPKWLYYVPGGDMTGIPTI